MKNQQNGGPRDESAPHGTGGPRLFALRSSVAAGRETPVTAYLKVARGPHSFLFESVEGGRTWGRYSIIGCDPFLTFRATGHEATVNEAGREYRAADVLGELRRLLETYRLPSQPGLPRLQAGLVGYLGFEAAALFERRLAGLLSPSPTPAIDLFAPRTILAFDNQEARLHLTVLADRQEGAAGLAEARDRLDEVLEALARPLAPEPSGGGLTVPRLQPSLSREQFEAMVTAGREAVLDGEAVQIVLSQAFTAETALDPFAAYRALRLVSPSPYLFHLDLGDTTLVGASPEVMVRVEEGQALLRPLAGTRPRGATLQADRRLEAELLADEKELAEHLMLLDLGRNDLGRVARPGGVSVEQAFAVERYSHVMHLTSTIRARLRAGTRPLDVLAACFPAGTVSGAPKVRAMELIAALEGEPRGPYAGAVGHLGFDGSADTCIAIRTLVFREGRVRVQAGAGIVADSEPRREYEETLHKSVALRRALELAATAGCEDDPSPHPLAEVLA